MPKTPTQFELLRDETRRRLAAELLERKRLQQQNAEALEAKRKEEWLRLDAVKYERVTRARREAQRLADAAILDRREKLDLSSYPELDEVPRFSHSNTLKHLDLHSTDISDLRRLSALTGLSTLNLSQCVNIEDISPLRDLSSLRSLNLNETSIRSLGPISKLELTSLNIRATHVADLRPIANMSSLLIGARRDHQGGGLTFSGNWITDVELIEIARWQNPTRTDRALSRLLDLSRAPKKNYSVRVPHPSESVLEQISDDELPADTDNVLLPLPEFPDQVPGPRFQLRADGVVDFAETEGLDLQGNDLNRLHELHGSLKQISEDLVSDLEGGANEHPRLFKLAKAYAQQIALPLSEVNFTHLFSVGTRLQMAAEAAKRDIAARMVPPLEDFQQESLGSLCLQHGVFMLSSAEGVRLLNAADAYRFVREDLGKLRSAAIEFSRLLQSQSHIVAPEVSQAIVEISESIEDCEHPERIVSYTYGAMANVLVTLGEIGVAIVVGATIGASGAAAAAAAWLFLREHASGKKAEGTLREVYSDIHSASVQGLASLLERGDRGASSFILGNKTLLRKLAQMSPRLMFLNHLIQWLESRESLQANP